MTTADESSALLRAVREASGNTLRHPGALGLLIKASVTGGRRCELDDLSFRAKFLWNTFTVMERIGKGSEGYEKLSAEFATNAEEAKRTLGSLTALLTSEADQAALRAYLEMTPGGFQRLLELFHDLSWLKNLAIDRRTGS